MKQLLRDFFQRDTIKVSQDLLGKILKIGSCSGRITEVEAYIGQDDPACHAARARTERNKVMFGPAGFLYVYFTYGMYHCANIVTEDEGFPAAVLIRSIEPIEGQELMIKRRGKSKNIADGPGKLCMAMGMTKETHNGLDLCEVRSAKCDEEVMNGVYTDDFQPKNIQTSSRIGIKAGLDKEWRFYYH